MSSPGRGLFPEVELLIIAAGGGVANHAECERFVLVVALDHALVKHGVLLIVVSQHVLEQLLARSK